MEENWQSIVTCTYHYQFWYIKTCF